MIRNLVLGALLSVGLLATAGTASAQYHRGGGHYHGGGHQHGGGHYHGGGYGRGIYSVPVVVAPRPILVSPGYGYGYGSPYYSPAFVSPRPYYGGYPGYGYGGYGGSFGTVNFGYNSPGFGMNLGFLFR